MEVPLRLYVRIARTTGGPRGVDVPRRPSDPPLVVGISAAAVPAFRVGDRVQADEMEALGDDTLARITAAADAYLAANPEDYPDFASVDEVRWAQRVAD